MKTKLLIEQHFHGCFGVDLNKATVEQVLELSKKLFQYGIGGVFPTLVTDTLENTRHSIDIIKAASEIQTHDMAKILGIHLEGIFLNPGKKGIHNPEHFLTPTVENYKLIENDFIKIVTLAPELDKDFELSKYLLSKGVKVQAGHCEGGDLSCCTGVTHLFNAMSGVVHRGKSTALSALIDDNLYAEVIADGVHVSDDALKLLFKSKPLDKIILVSDSLPITKSDKKEMIFADEKVYYDGVRATSADGTIAGSTTLLPEIIKRLYKSGLLFACEEFEQLIENPYHYHNIDLSGSVEWDEDWNIIKVEKL